MDPILNVKSNSIAVYLFSQQLSIKSIFYTHDILLFYIMSQMKNYCDIEI